MTPLQVVSLLAPYKMDALNLPKFTASITSKNDQAVMTVGILKCCSAKLLRD